MALVCPGSGTGLPSPALPAAGVARWPVCRGSRPSGFPETSGRAAVSRPVSTALRRQGRSVARAKGPTPPSSTAAPCGIPPRRCLRGVQATTSSRTNGSVRQSAQRSADRSVQPRSQGRCAAGLPPRTAGLPGRVPAPHRLGNALKEPLCLASPHRLPKGLTRKAPASLRSARATRSYHPPSTS
jgi:hypothetical protein